MPLAALLERRPAAAAPGLGVLVRSADPGLAPRLVLDALDGCRGVTRKPDGSILRFPLGTEP